MWRATEEFGLEFNDLDDGDDTVGVWDGEKFLITVRFISRCRHEGVNTYGYANANRLEAAAAGGTP